MKHYLLLVTLLLTNLLAKAQTLPPAPPTPHIKIILVGTFHFGATLDHHRTSFPDLFSARRQAELQQLATKLARLHPTKFFVENEPRRQAYWDSTYAQYLRNPADTVGRRNEIVQVGLRTAQLAGLPRVTCVDYQQALPYAQLEAFNKRIEHDTAAISRLQTVCALLPIPSRNREVSYPHPVGLPRLH